MAIDPIVVVRESTNSQIVTKEVPQTRIVVQRSEAPRVIERLAVGPAGPRGPQGASGDGSGEAPADSSYLHVQNVAQSVWTISHNMQFDPAGITVIDNDGFILEGWGIQYLDPGVSLRLSFDIPSSGKARLS